jgi:hypothetical protein
MKTRISSLLTISTAVAIIAEITAATDFIALNGMQQAFADTKK